MLPGSGVNHQQQMTEAPRTSWPDASASLSGSRRMTARGQAVERRPSGATLAPALVHIIHSARSTCKHIRVPIPCPYFTPTLPTLSTYAAAKPGTFAVSRWRLLTSNGVAKAVTERRRPPPLAKAGQALAGSCILGILPKWSRI